MVDQANEALSVLNAIEEQSKFLDRQFSAFRNVRKVIEAYQIAVKGIADLDRHRTSLEESIARLGPRYDAEHASIQKQLSSERQAAEGEIASLHGRMQEAKHRLELVNQELEAREAILVKRTSEIESAIESKTLELEGLRKDIDSLKAKLDLV